MDHILKILVIDRDPNKADKIVRIVKSSGYAVRETVASSKQQLEEIKELEVNPHLIIHSNNVADVSIHELRSSFDFGQHDTPIIALFSETNKQQSELMNEGANIVLPYEDNEQLRLTVTQVAKTEFYIQELKTQADNYKELEQRYNKILDTSHNAICYIHEGLHTYANVSYLEFFNIQEPDDAHVLSILELVSPDDQNTLKSILKNVSKTRISGNATLTFKTSEGLIETDVEYSPILVDGETCVQFMLHIETGDSKELQEQLSYLSERDHETGFFHRKSITDQIQDAINAHQEGKDASTYIQVDIANIDTIKDQHGVIAIDKLGTHIAETMKKVCSDDDLLGKVTDDSYGILTSLNEDKELIELGNKLKEAISNNTISIKDQKISPDITIGAAILDSKIEDVSDALSAAKSACDQAWEQESDELFIFSNDSRSLTGTLLDQKWTQELNDAINENRLQLLYQPIVSITGSSDDRYQVYTQLVSKEGAKISVAELLPSIERSGVSAMLDRWVVSTALKRLAEHTQQNPNSLFFIKLTAGALNDESFTSWLEGQCKDNNVDPFRLVFDLREESIISHLKDAKDFSTRLQQVGCQLAIDAFGISQEPGKILSMIPASYLKLSFQLMASLKNGDQNSFDSIKQICEDAKNNNTMTIAPFIESAELLSQIWTINIDFVSGDFFSEPNENLGYDFSSAA